MSSDGRHKLTDRLRDQEGKIKEFVLAKDWRQTPLGAIEDWPPSLNFAVNLCLHAKFPIAIWWGDHLVNIYNESFRHLLNLTQCEGLGASSVELGQGFPKEMTWSLQRVLQEGVPTVISHKFTKDSGDEILSFYNSPLYDGTGKVGGVFTTVTCNGLPIGDSSEGKEEHNTILADAYILKDELEKKVRDRTLLLEKRNEELKRSEERYTKMTEEVEDYAIILLDMNGTILNWNKGAQKIKGYTESEIIGRNFSVFYLEEDLVQGLPGTLIHTAIKEGRATHEGYRKRKDNSKFWGSVVITALHDEFRNVIGFTKVTRDLSEKKAAEDLIKQHALELEIKNKQLEQFAYIASHDLQEPLRKIQTFVQILEKRFDDNEIRHKYFTKINASAKRMTDLIQSVLHYSRLAQPNDLHESVNLNEVMNSVMNDYELLISEKNALVEYGQLPVIRGIKAQLGQLFANLLGNSLKFSNLAPKIAISSRLVLGSEIQHEFATANIAGEYVEVTFSDNGIGFEQQYVEKIFGIFKRLNSRDKFPGTGIGLALSKKIVDNHNGFITARSELGKGATFFIYLPHK